VGAPTIAAGEDLISTFERGLDKINAGLKRSRVQGSVQSRMRREVT
jgi:hypothetical protein